MWTVRKIRPAVRGHPAAAVPGSKLLGPALLALGALAVLSGCNRTSDYLRFEGPTMGTYYRISARCEGPAVDSVEAAVVQELSQVNLEMSTYQADSELSLINAAPLNSWYPLSENLQTVLAAAQRIASLSDGAFDVTVGPLVNLWGFGPDGAVSRAPDPRVIEQAIARVGMDYLELDRAAGAVRKSRELYIDLSAIAKGHGVDRVAALLSRLNCTDYLVDIGGEVFARGTNPAGQRWRVGIEVPDPDRMGGVQRVLQLSGRAVATSGDYRNFLDLDQQRVSHTIDPRTGLPVQHLLASVSVVHESAMWADGLATALNVLGPAAGYALAQQEQLAALFLIRRAAGFEERYTPAMQAYLDSP